jgi:hypothetical protein
MSFKYFLIVCSLVFVTTSCSKKADDLDLVIEAQECLDKYSQEGGDINVCAKKVEGIETPAAYGIRCSIGYIREGLTTSALIAAFAELETTDAQNVRDFLNLISFDEAGTGNTTLVRANTDAARASFDVCSDSQAKGATIIAAYSYITNLLYQYSCDNDGVGTPADSCNAADDDLAGALAAIRLGVPVWPTNDPTTQIGSIVIAAQQVSCQSGEANKSLCDFFNRAIDVGGSNANAVGEAFIDVLLTP